MDVYDLMDASGPLPGQVPAEFTRDEAAEILRMDAEDVVYPHGLPASWRDPQEVDDSALAAFDEWREELAAYHGLQPPT